MAIQKKIESLHNPLVKKILRLKEKSRERKKLGRFVIEGLREMELALKAGYELESLMICPEIMDASKMKKWGATTIHLSHQVYEKVAHRGSTEGIIAIAKTKSHDIKRLRLRENPIILVAEAPEKPGNIGALLRTADAANLDAVLIANPKSDVYNPNIIRSSVGCVFTTQIGLDSTAHIIQFLKTNSIKVFCAALTASKTYTFANFLGPAAIVVGTEANGLSNEWLKNADQNIIIPMQGEIDSMNVSVSAAILIFEAKRQRGF
ncbi:MAG: RNA methyltransferase [Bacteroidota bacterium]